MHDETPKTWPDCGHPMCLMEEAIHDAGKCTEFDQIVIGVYCPIVTCRQNPFPPGRVGLARVRREPYYRKDRWPEARWGNWWRAHKAKVREGGAR